MWSSAKKFIFSCRLENQILKGFANFVYDANDTFGSIKIRDHSRGNDDPKDPLEAGPGTTILSFGIPLGKKSIPKNKTYTFTHKHITPFHCFTSLHYIH